MTKSDALWIGTVALATMAGTMMLTQAPALVADEAPGAAVVAAPTLSIDSCDITAHLKDQTATPAGTVALDGNVPAIELLLENHGGAPATVKATVMVNESRVPNPLSRVPALPTNLVKVDVAETLAPHGKKTIDLQLPRNIQPTSILKVEATAGTGRPVTLLTFSAPQPRNTVAVAAR